MQNKSQVSDTSLHSGQASPQNFSRRFDEAHSFRMPPIRHLKKMLDELEVKLDARKCLQDNGRHRYARRIPVERGFLNFLKSLQNLIDDYLSPASSASKPLVNTVEADSKSHGPSDQSTVRIQLKLSPALVRVLQTAKQEQVKASDLVESVMWNSPRIQDTAQLAGIRRPRRKPAA
ncbi:MAG: hypothetical protein MK102_07970 [Fuerstiella sp.]|nr:hypothetical protein [Fuerstiella sp.]